MKLGRGSEPEIEQPFLSKLFAIIFLSLTNQLIASWRILTKKEGNIGSVSLFIKDSIKIINILASSKM